jgi:hypothetical protein
VRDPVSSTDERVIARRGHPPGPTPPVGRRASAYTTATARNAASALVESFLMAVTGTETPAEGGAAAGRGEFVTEIPWPHDAMPPGREAHLVVVLRPLRTTEDARRTA